MADQRLAGGTGAYGPVPTLFCSGDECLQVWPEGPMPDGWTVENVEGRMEPCCADCTAFYAAQASEVCGFVPGSAELEDTERRLPCVDCDCCEAESCEALLCMGCPCHAPDASADSGAGGAQ